MCMTSACEIYNLLHALLAMYFACCGHDHQAIVCSMDCYHNRDNHVNHKYEASTLSKLCSCMNMILKVIVIITNLLWYN